MRNTAWIAGGLVAAVLAVTACSSSSTTSGGNASGGGLYGAGYGATSSATTGTSAGSTLTSSTSSKGGLMEVKKTMLGEILANPHGLTVYYFTADKPGSGKSACNSSCAAAWPPVGYPVRLPAGAKLPGAGTLGYIVRAGGNKQLTINGWPVYRYAGDKAPGEYNGQGLGGKWFVIKVTVGKTSTMGSSSSSSSSSGSGGSGW